VGHVNNKHVHRLGEELVQQGSHVAYHLFLNTYRRLGQGEAVTVQADSEHMPDGNSGLKHDAGDSSLQALPSIKESHPQR